MLRPRIALAGMVHGSFRTAEHPVKGLEYGSVEEQDRLVPSDLLPVKVQFDNSRQDKTCFRMG